MVASQHIAIQDHRNKDNRISSLRSIGALAFAEVQKRGENNKTTRANIKRGKTGREQRNGTEGSNTPAQRHLSRVPHLHACEAQSRLREEGPSGGPFRPMPLMRIGV